MLINSDGYFKVLDSIKKQIQEAQCKIVNNINREMIDLYWNIGRIILENTKYGTAFIENLSRDIRADFPDTKGYSVRNLQYMRLFAQTYPDIAKMQQGVALLSWRNNIVLLDKIKNESVRDWYISQNIENGWSSNVLAHQIDLKLYERQVLSEKINNFNYTLPSPMSEMITQAMKDPYIFDFVNAAVTRLEREVERELVSNITKFLLELGSGFSFIGQQYHLSVGDQDFYIDLLFYNIKLHCYFAIELKNTEFKPEYAGQLNFYLNAINGELCKDGDNPTVGLLLCREKNNLVAEYALKNIDQPIGISKYEFFQKLPDKLADTLPSAEDIEKRIKLK